MGRAYVATTPCSVSCPNPACAGRGRCACRDVGAPRLGGAPQFLFARVEPRQIPFHEILLNKRSEWLLVVCALGFCPLLAAPTVMGCAGSVELVRYRRTGPQMLDIGISLCAQWAMWPLRAPSSSPALPFCPVWILSAFPYSSVCVGSARSSASGFLFLF